MRVAVPCVGVIMFAMMGCSHVSQDFRRDAAYTYNLLNAAENGGSIQKSQVEEGLAKAKADAHTDTERRLIQTLEHYRGALSPTYVSPVSRRYLEVCRWESAHGISQPEPTLSKSAQVGDCEKFYGLYVGRDLEYVVCATGDSQLNDLLARLGAAKSNHNPSIWLKVYDQYEKLNVEVEKHCSENADAKVQVSL
jgi:hypothetical protein